MSKYIAIRSGVFCVPIRLIDCAYSPGFCTKRLKFGMVRHGTAQYGMVIVYLTKSKTR